MILAIVAGMLAVAAPGMGNRSKTPTWRSGSSRLWRSAACLVAMAALLPQTSRAEERGRVSAETPAPTETPASAKADVPADKAAPAGSAVSAETAVAPKAAALPNVNRVVLLPGTGENVHPDHVRQARAHLLQQLRAEKDLTVIDRDGTPRLAPPTRRMTAEAARDTQADLAVALVLSHQAQETVLHLYGLSPDGKIAFEAHQAVSAPQHVLYLVANLEQRFGAWRAGRRSADELPPPAPKPAAALIARRAAPVPISSCGPPEPGVPRRRVGVQFSAGALVAIGNASGGTVTLAAGDLSLYVDAIVTMVDIGVQLAAAGEERVTAGKVAVNAPLRRDDLAPYLGGGVRAGWTHLGGRGAAGVGVQGQAGVVWGRYSPVRLRAELSYFVDLFEEHEPDRLVPGGGAGHQTHGVLFMVGLGL